MIKYCKIFSNKAVAVFRKSTVGTLCIIVASLFILSAGCAENENGDENEIVSLKDTKWKMVGFVDTKTGKVTETIVPTETEWDKCYTLTFDTDSTASGRSFVNIVFLFLKPVLYMSVATEAYDNEVGNVSLFYEAIESLESYTVGNNVLKIFYNNKKNYLHYKRIEP